MAESQHDLVVIGAGPGGDVAAIRAARLGMSVAVVERDSALEHPPLVMVCMEYPSGSAWERYLLLYSSEANPRGTADLSASPPVFGIPRVMK